MRVGKPQYGCLTHAAVALKVGVWCTLEGYG
jgi:hypothetical protein